MGLPVWREPVESDSKSKSRKETAKVDATAHLRSSIRRRPSVHGRRATVRPPPRSTRSSSPGSQSRSTLEPPRRRTDDRAVPPLSSLLEFTNQARATTARRRLHRHSLANGQHGQSLMEAIRNSEAEFSNGLQDVRQRALRLQERASGLSAASPRPSNTFADEAAAARTEPHRGRRHLASLTPLMEQPSLGRGGADHAVDARISDSRTGDISNRESIPDRRPFGRPATHDYADFTHPNEPSNRAAQSQAEPTSSDQVARQQHFVNELDDRSMARGQSQFTSHRRSALPTPSSDASDSGNTLERAEPSTVVLTRPQSRAQDHPSTNGLGDRNRSPTPVGVWQLTIIPDTNLASADSSFTGAMAASQTVPRRQTSNSSSSRGTSAEETDRNASSEDIQMEESVSSLDFEELLCDELDEDELDDTADIAEDMYFSEMRGPEGRERMQVHRRVLEAEGPIFTQDGEPDRVEIGFRLMSAALDSAEGRARLLALAQENDAELDVEWLRRVLRIRQRAGSHLFSSPRRDEQDEESDSSSSSSSAIEDYQRAFDDAVATAAARAASRSNNGQRGEEAGRERERRSASRNPAAGMLAPTPPPPPAAAHSAPAAAAHDAPPAAAHNAREVLDSMLTASGDEHDLDSMRRIVERLAARDDVPDEWWMGLGLNLSRTQVRNRSRSRSPERRRRRRGRSSHGAGAGAGTGSGYEEAESRERLAGAVAASARELERERERASPPL